MRIIRILFLSFVLCITQTACEKQLNTTPTDFILPSNYYKTEDQFNKALAGVYDILGDPSLYQEALLSYMSHNTDESIFLPTTGTSLPPSNYSYTSSDRNITNIWNALYRGINNANIVLEALESKNASAIKQTFKDNIKAQAIFLRAYYFYMLAERWGDIPMPLTATQSGDDIDLAATAVKEVYQQIINDMIIAEAVLPQASVLGANSSGRISKNTAQGILSRVCLSMAGFPIYDRTKYEDALKWSSKVISAGENSLNPSYSDLFVKEARDEYYVNENIWEVEFFGNVSNENREQGFVGVRNGASATNGLTYPGYGYVYLGVSIGLYNKYAKESGNILSKDLRFARNIAPYKWTGGSASSQIMTKSYPTLATGQREPAKWRREEETLLPRFKNGNSTNFPLLRYSDVLLMFAEAENEINGPTSAAYNAINQVRERAYGTGYRVNAIFFNLLTQGGSGYTVAPIVSFESSGDPNGASTAEAYTTILNGKVSSVNLVNMGAFYSSNPPKITITSANGLGSGATATASVVAINPSEADLRSGLSKDQFLQEIIDERSRELAYECLRFQDLRRWGKLISTVKDLATLYGSAVNGSIYRNSSVNIENKHLFYPIPPTEIATNSLIKQNPEW